jgi:hypothetical protein
VANSGITSARTVGIGNSLNATENIANKDEDMGNGTGAPKSTAPPAAENLASISGVSQNVVDILQRQEVAVPKKAPTSSNVAAEKKAPHKCSASSWAGRLGSKDVKPALVRFAPKNSAVATEQKSLLALLNSTSASGERRQYVKLAGAQHCTQPNKVSLYDMGVLTRFRRTILRGDVTTDCGGPVVRARAPQPGGQGVFDPLDGLARPP